MSKREIKIVFEDDEKSSESSHDVVFHIKHKFTLHGFTMYDILMNQETFQYIHYFKRSVCRIDICDLDEKWKHPLIIDMKEKIENEFGMKVRGVFLNLYKDGDDYAPYHRDSYGGNGVFTVSVGGKREFLTKNDKTGKITKYMLEDGDLFFFNSEFNKQHKHSIPKRKKLNNPRISIVFFV